MFVSNIVQGMKKQEMRIRGPLWRPIFHEPLDMPTANSSQSHWQMLPFSRHRTHQNSKQAKIFKLKTSFYKFQNFGVHKPRKALTSCSSCDLYCRMLHLRPPSLLPLPMLVSSCKENTNTTRSELPSDSMHHLKLSWNQETSTPLDWRIQPRQEEETIHAPSPCMYASMWPLHKGRSKGESDMSSGPPNTERNQTACLKLLPPPY